LSLCLITHIEIKNNGEVKIQLNAFLTSPLQDCSVLIPQKEQPVHWIAGWVDTTVALEVVEKRRIVCPCREKDPDFSVLQRLFRLSCPGSPYCLAIIPVGRGRNKVSSHLQQTVDKHRMSA
jgi:hypothetical protein